MKFKLETMGRHLFLRNQLSKSGRWLASQDPKWWKLKTELLWNLELRYMKKKVPAEQLQRSSCLACSEESAFLGAALEGLDTDECSVGNKQKLKVLE